MSALTPIIGSAASLSDVLSALSTALTSNGYSFSGGANQTYAKGNVAAALTIVGAGTAQVLQMNAGTGVDGSGVLQNPAPQTPCLRAGLMGTSKTNNIVWPVEYRIFIYTNPDMWVIAMKHDTAYWQFMMNGITINHGHPGIAGVVPFFYASFSGASMAARFANNVNLNTSTNAGVTGQNANNSAFPFWMQASSVDVNCDNASAYINEPLTFNGLDALTWSPRVIAISAGRASQSNWQNTTILSANPILGRLPNKWNNDSQLVPLTVQDFRPSSFVSQGFEIPHLRIMRNDFYNDGDIITLGSDSWMTLPARRKNAVARAAFQNVNIDDSGTYAYAFEYVAP